MSVSREQVDALLAPSRAPCLSVFLAIDPEDRVGEQGRLRVKHLLEDAERALTARGLRPAEIATMLDPARPLLDPGPWPARVAALAVYLSRDGDVHRFELQLPLEDRVVAADRFILRPLISEATRTDRFWLLSLSRGAVELFRGDASALHEVTEIELPTFDDVVGMEAEENLQLHHGAGGPARATATYHGHGGLKDAEKDRIGRWLQVVAGRVDEQLRDDRSPVVLTGVAETLAAYRRASRHPSLLEADLPGNAARSSSAELHERAWPLVAAWQQLARDRDLRRYREHDGTAWTVHGYGPVTRAANEGRVEVLFGPAVPDPREEVALDAIVTAVWVTAGTLHLVDGPGDGDARVAAILRYPASSPSAPGG